MIYLSNDPYPQEISIPRSFGVIVPRRTEYLTRDDIAPNLQTDSDRKVLAASQGVRLKEKIDGKADADDVYTKTEVDDALADKADKDDTYTKQQVDSALASKADKSSVYTKQQTDNLLDGKQDTLTPGENIRIENNVISANVPVVDAYTKQQTDALLSEKADKSSVYTKQQVDTALEQKANATDIPTKTSDLQNDSGFVTGQEVSQTYETKADATEKVSALQTAINGKQDKINDLQTIRDGAAAGATAYQKPSTGIPATDLAQGVIPPAEVFWAVYGVTTAAEIDAAVAAGKVVIARYVGQDYLLSKHASGDSYYYFGNILGSSFCWLRLQVSNNTWVAGVQGGEVVSNKSQSVETDKTSTTKYPSTKAVADALAGKQDTIDADHKLDYSLLENTPTIPAAQVPADWDATSGVSRILNKPTIPAAQVNSDWNATSGVAQILNKPSIPVNYAGSPTPGGFATKAVAIPYGEVIEGSTDTNILAQVDNFPTELVDGVCAYIRNNRRASASGWTLNINGTGAKPVYASNADATRVTTLFSAAVTYLFIYNSTRVNGGCWDMYYGYNANDNTIGYNLRTNTMSLPVTSACYRYRLLFTSADGTHFVPANASTSTNATSKRTTTQTKIDPFGSIRYYGSTSAVSSDARPGATILWEQYLVTLGYSFNRTGAALTLTAWKPVYIKCTPQADGSAIIEAETPYVQDLPTSADGKIYIYLGVATSATQVEVVFHHPVYYYKYNSIRLWNGVSQHEPWVIPVSYRDNNAKVTLREYNYSNSFPLYVLIKFNDENQIFFDLVSKSYIAPLQVNVPAGYFARYIAIGDESVYFEPVDATSFKVNGITFTYNSETGDYETDQWTS